MPKPRKPNQKAEPRASRRARATNDKIASLVAEIEDALGSARALGRALELMALGMRALEDDYSGALITVTESVLRHLDGARASCGEILAEIGA